MLAENGSRRFTDYKGAQRQNRQTFGDESQPQNYETLLVLTKSCIESCKRKTIADVSIWVILLLLDDSCSGGCDDGMLLQNRL